MAIREILERLRAKRSNFKDVQEQDQIQTRVTTMKKNSNERELERFQEEDRQAQIKSQLNGFREREKVRDRDSSMFRGKNMFVTDSTAMNNNNNLFSSRMDGVKESGGFMFHGS